MLLQSVKNNICATSVQIYLKQLSFWLDERANAAAGGRWLEWIKRGIEACKAHIGNSFFMQKVS